MSVNELLIAPALALSLSLGCGRNTNRDHAALAEPVRVAAAADTAVAFEELRVAFTQATGRNVEYTYGSTGMLARQLAEGAPFDVFAAAHMAFVDEVVRAGVCDASTKTPYARGRLVVWTKDAAKLPKDLVELAHPRFVKIALANPEHAPYGIAARQALIQAGVWSALERRAVYGENVQQALAYARTGNVDAAIVARSLVMPGDGHVLPIEPSLHAPLDQALVVCDGGLSASDARKAKRGAAEAFVRFVGSEAGRAIMRKHGLLLPGEDAKVK